MRFGDESESRYTGYTAGYGYIYIALYKQSSGSAAADANHSADSWSRIQHTARQLIGSGYAYIDMMILLV